MIDINFIDRIKKALNIIDVIGSFTHLQKAGVNWKAICPFHDDSHPSMVVSEARQTYHCFVCGASGDVISFVQNYLNLTFVESVRWCSNRAGLEFPEREMTIEEEKAYKNKESQLIAIAAAAKFFQSNLSQAESFLNNRGYSCSDKVLADFGVGYAPQGNILLRELVATGYNLDRLREVGVVGSTEGRDYDFFRDRIMFPFYDLQGRVIAFSGRIVTIKEGVGKYVNTGNTPLFKKGNNIFGLYQARKAIGRKGLIYIVEGQFDVITLYKYGVENVIAGSGTAMTDEQIKLIMRFAQKVVMIYDADTAGIHAALKNCELLLKCGADVKIIRLPKGQDPDNFGNVNKDKTGDKLFELTETFPKAFKRLLVPRGCNDEGVVSAAINTISELISCVQDSALRLEYIRNMARDFNTKMDVLDNKIRDIRRNVDKVRKTKMESGLYGLDVFGENIEHDKPGVLTSVLQNFLDGYGESAIIYVAGVPSLADIQNLRRTYSYFISTDDGCHINPDGSESDYLKSLLAMFRSGISQLSIIHEEIRESFVDFYIRIHGEFIDGFTGDKVPLITRCIELTSYSEDTVVTVNRNHYCSLLHLTKGQFDEIRKPFVAKRKSALKVNQQSDNLEDCDFDKEEIPSYVDDNEEFSRMWRECKYYPRLNKNGDPICYMFQNKNGNGFTQVGDFYMTPLLHIFNDDFEQNKRVLKINRRYFDTPLYIEISSKALLKMSTIEEVLINYEAVNLTNCEEWQWRRIREYMSRHFVMCSEIKVYGNQQSEGTSRKADEQFFAFANGIFHNVDGVLKFETVNELGVVTHNKKNYYLPAFSTIYAGSGRQSDKYELISQLVYKDVPASQQVTFEHWADLMNRVYKMNHNGMWAIVFAIMCAFRSNIHCIDRLFTAPFFMGPMSSGKTQIAISIRSLFISPQIPIFNLNTGTDAAMSTIMGLFRDVPVVLDEYNNKDISDTKFQALKGIVYDGDGKQKRRGTSGKEIENDKVFAPVIICGQETPQRDDNALMSRVIICEVPKPKNRTQDEVRLFEKLKDIENPDKIGLSNVLLKVLSLRPMIIDHFRKLKQEAYEELKHDVINSGEMDRLMKTVSLFLGMVKLIERYSELKLPFTYEEFFAVAQSKIKFQLSLIRSTDKLAMFFTSVNNMIDTKQVVEGREFTIEQPKKVTGTDVRGDKRTFTFEPETNVMFIRLSAVFAIYDRSGYNTEATTLSTLDQNLRSHPSYIGTVPSRRFEWEETVEVPRDDDQETMVRIRKKKSTPTSAIIVNYDIFKKQYNMDFRRDENNEELKNLYPKNDDTPF